MSNITLNFQFLLTCLIFFSILYEFIRYKIEIYGSIKDKIQNYNVSINFFKIFKYIKDLLDIKLGVY